MKTSAQKFSDDVAKALVKHFVRIGLDERASQYVVSNYDFYSYILEGTLSHLEAQIIKVSEIA